MTTTNGSPNNSEKSNEITLTLSKKCLIPIFAVGFLALSFLVAALTTGTGLEKGPPSLWDVWRFFMMAGSFVVGSFFTIWSIIIIFDL